jgi:hypothetical protein
VAVHLFALPAVPAHHNTRVRCNCALDGHHRIVRLYATHVMQTPTLLLARQ